MALTLCMGQPMDIYLIDVRRRIDSEQRIWASKVIKRFIIHSKKTAFIVEHDFIMASYLADRVIVYTGTPAVDATAHSPCSLLTHEPVPEAPRGRRDHQLPSQINKLTP